GGRRRGTRPRRPGPRRAGAQRSRTGRHPALRRPRHRGPALGPRRGRGARPAYAALTRVPSPAPDRTLRPGSAGDGGAMGRAGRPGSLARAVLGWVLLAGLTSAAAVGTHAPLRSELYPEDWQPGVPDDAGRLLPDVSYAGYRYGQEPPANVPGPVVDVTDPPYGADPSGEEDATAAIQRALDDVGAAGGGTVHLPAGTYRVEPPDDSRAVLHIGYDGVLLRGAGAAATRLYNATARDMRERAVVLLAPDRRDRVSWHEEHTAAAAASRTRSPWRWGTGWWGVPKRRRSGWPSTRSPRTSGGTRTPSTPSSSTVG